MKTLKQIREEYKNFYTSQVPEEVLLEKSVIPSTKEMPAIILFKRVSFRSYPKGQVVALYYSSLMDKYLSIPIGPDNVNLSEAKILDENDIDEACWKGYKQYGMKKKKGKDVPNCVPVKEDGPGNPSYTTRPTYEHFKDNLEKLREERVDEFVAPLIGAGLRMVGGSLAKQALKQGAKSLLKKGIKGVKDAILGTDDKKDDKSTDTDPAIKVATPSAKSKATAKVSSSWENRPGANPVQATKERQALYKENTISDIRAMVKEGIDSKNLSINGRTITLNTSMAKRILEVYDSVNTKNKKIVEGMLNEDLESFKKLLNFSIRN